MSKFNDLLQGYVNMSYDELVSMADQNLHDIFPALEEFFKDFPGEDPTTEIVIMLLANCLGADNKLSALECKFVNEILHANHSYDALSTMVEVHCNSDAEEILDNMIDALNASATAAVLSFCLCLLAVDETISRDEVAFFTRLMD
jgi:uncharacterized tellurite resistance protein B-like protein